VSVFEVTKCYYYFIIGIVIIYLFYILDKSITIKYQILIRNKIDKYF